MTGPNGGSSDGGGTGPGRTYSAASPDMPPVDPVKPQPFPPPPKHLVDHGFRVEVWSRDSRLLAVAEVRTAGLWWMQTAGHEAYYIGGREQATSAMRELAVAS